MRLPLALAVPLVLFGLAGAIAVFAQPTASTVRTRTPVLVELFTSEGCSSCPPADALLSRLVTDQPIDGVEVIGLSLHVDYWNRLGWVDPFSQSAFTDRQNDYAAIWGVSRIYTPQAVVDGAREFVGSDWPAAREFIRAAATTPKVPLSIALEAPRRGSDRISVGIDLSRSAVRASKVDIWMAVVEDGLVSDVRRGENAGKRLAHVGVVRALHRVARVDAEKGLATTATLRLEPAWRPEQLRAVVFVQDPVTRAVIGVASRRLGLGRPEAG